MKSQIRWLHLSDLHIGKDISAQKKFCDSIVQHVAAKGEEGYSPDFIFITGDIANKGQKTEYDIFFNDFLMELISAASIEDFNRIIIVPGNHDVDIEEAKSVRRYGVYNDIDTFFDADENGLKERKYLLDRFKEFFNHDSQTFGRSGENHWLQQPMGCLIRQFNENKIAIIGLNTAWRSK
jgi:3',5'-cyclic AMP phosphodiesterase CpdA